MKVLLLAQWNWHGPARIPKELKRAGCEVGAICKKGDWVSMTRFVDHHFFVDTNQEGSIIDRFDYVLNEWRPDIVLPGTDNMASTLLKYRHAVLIDAIPLDLELKQVLLRSFPDPAKEKYLKGKFDLLEALGEKGIPIPPQKDLVTLGDADAFVQEHGYPVVLKPDEGFAGLGVTICQSEEELLPALNKLLFAPVRQRYLIQKGLGNKTATIHFAALDGKVLAANCIRRLHTYPGDTGPTSVARVVKSRAMREVAEATCELMGYNGLGSVQFMVEDEDCERVYPIELNPRLSSFMHLGRLIGTDLVSVLVNAWQGKRYTVEPAREGLTIALYPHEVLRDKDSEFLQGLRDTVDDDPDLAAEYSRLIDERWSSSKSER